MASQARTTPKVNADTFTGISWGCSAVSLGFLIFRIFVRLHSFKRIYADDVLVIFAWFMLLATSIIWQTQKKSLYAQYGVAAGTAVPTPGFISDQETLQRLQVPIIMFLYCSLWSVKLSFLLFFRRLEQKVKAPRRKIWWWCVLGFTVATWATCIGDIQYSCLLSSFEWIIAHCSSGSGLSFQWATLHWNCAADVLSDATIMTIPFLMLWNVKVAWRKKLALMGIFSLTVIVIVFSIVRVSVVTTKKSQADITWLYMWSFIEMAIAIIVACLASFRQLFVKSAQSAWTPESGNKSSSWRQGLLSAYQSMKSKTSLNHVKPLSTKGHSFEQASSIASHERIIPLEGIHVEHYMGRSSFSQEEGRKDSSSARVYNTSYSGKPAVGR